MPPSGITYHEFGDDPSAIVDALSQILSAEEYGREIEYVANYFKNKHMSSVRLLGATLNAVDRAIESCGTERLAEVRLHRQFEGIIKALKQAAVRSWPREEERPE